MTRGYISFQRGAASFVRGVARRAESLLADTARCTLLVVLMKVARSSDEERGSGPTHALRG